MTLDELKAEAKKHGYNLIPIRKNTKMIPCICGRNRREHYDAYRNGKWCILLRCKCGIEAYGNTEEHARVNWNATIEKLKMEVEHDGR